MRRREKTARRTLQERPWRAVIADWQARGRAEWEGKNLALQDVDMAALSDAEVIAHARRVFDHCVAGVEHHFWLHGYDLGPIGLLLADCKRWGIEPAEVIPLLEGASPSTSAPAQSMLRLRSAIEEARIEPRSLDDVRRLSPEAAAQLDDFLHRRGAVLFSRYDVEGVTLGELPDLVLSIIMNASVRDIGATVAERAKTLRQRVPEAERAAFDERLTEARAAMDLRDDNGPTTAEWPLGLLRLALLEVGRRMVANGLAATPEDAFDLESAELVPGTMTGNGPSADELAARRARRRSNATADAPLALGPVEPPPPLSVLPTSLGKFTGAVLMVIEQIGMGGERADTGLRGSGIGTSTYRGVARRASSPEEALDVLEPGDVLIVPCTTPAYNSVVSLAGALITADGGPLSHAAVLARELGIPAVVGARGALFDIPDGAMVEVDPVAGEIRILQSLDAA
jgi:pyruvate,water dikinase